VACAQWTIQNSNTTADLYSVDASGSGVAWASGANGTVLRTQNNGDFWQVCSVPLHTEHADFRAIQAIDGQSAVVMSSGKGRLSRLYKTSDGCKTWKLVFENPDEAGSFANLRRISASQFYLLGQPVEGKFPVFLSQDGGETWFATDDPGLDAQVGLHVAGNSNAAMYSEAASLYFGTVGGEKSYVYFTYPKCDKSKGDGQCAMAWDRAEVPIAAGIASIAFRTQLSMATGELKIIGVAVGGNPDTPGYASASAAYTVDGKVWKVATAMPGGYRSAVGYNKAARTWIAVGPNGIDISSDNGRTWRPLKTDAKDSQDTDKNWTAISFPFVVGPHGRIGKSVDDNQ